MGIRQEVAERITRLGKSITGDPRGEEKPDPEVKAAQVLEELLQLRSTQTADIAVSDIADSYNAIIPQVIYTSYISNYGGPIAGPTVRSFDTGIMRLNEFNTKVIQGLNSKFRGLRYVDVPDDKDPQIEGHPGLAFLLKLKTDGAQLTVGTLALEVSYPDLENALLRIKKQTYFQVREGFPPRAVGLVWATEFSIDGHFPTRVHDLLDQT